MKEVIIDSEYDLKSIKHYSIYVNNLPKNVKRSQLKNFFESLVIKGQKLKVFLFIEILYVKILKNIYKTILFLF
jgi:RNA recognition motif-containing protein